MVLGSVVLFYVMYVLWGTSVYTQQAQAELRRQIAEKPLVSDGSVLRGEIPPARPTTPAPIGSALFTLDVPKITLRTVVVNGVSVEALKKGPGRFPDCREQGNSGTEIVECLDGAPWPGEEGNLALSGHRTTYGAPFYRIDELAAGDPITIEAGAVRYRYRVREQRIVSPEQVDVVEDHGRSELTLFACHPRFSAARRIVVHAEYVGAELLPSQFPPPPASGEPDQTAPTPEPVPVPDAPAPVPPETIALGAISVFSLLAALALDERWRRRAVGAMVTISAAAGLWSVVFPQILRLMPANY